MSGAITLTFGDVAENHVGMKKHGDKAISGLSIEQLQEAQGHFELQGARCELLELSGVDRIPGIPRATPAALLIVRDGVNILLDTPAGADLLLAEQEQLEVDTKALMRGRVVNKHARHNLCFSDVGCEPNYELGQGRVISYGVVPYLDRIRARLPEYFGVQATALQTEGNYYYDITKCGIGFHGDGERRIVVAVRLGESIPLHYQWFYHNSPVGSRIVVNPPLRHGDLYAMSEKAVGTDWRRSSMMTLRHAAGSSKFTSVVR